MIEIWTRNERDGRYLTVSQRTKDLDMEIRMIEKISSPYILKPQIAEGIDEVLFSYDIRSLESLKDFLNGRPVTEAEITGIMIAVNAAAGEMRSHLLSEEHLILDDRYIFVDRYDYTVRLCALAEPNQGVADQLRTLTRDIILHVDTEDEAAVKLSLMLFRETSREEFMLYDLMDAMRLARKGSSAPRVELPEIAEKEASYPEAVTSKLSIEELDAIDIGEELNPDNEETPADAKKAVLIKIGISQIIMIAALAAAWFIKGKELGLKSLMVVYILLSLCLGAYFALGSKALEEAD